MNELSCDNVLCGNLKILQPKDGPRVNMDTILLASWVKVHAGGKNFLEAGCATGAISLILAKKFGNNFFITGLDIQPELIELAKINAENNNLSEKTNFIAGDLRDKNIFPSLGIPQRGQEIFDGLVINPPYESLKASRPGANFSRTTARLENFCTPEDVAEFAARVLKSRGRLFAIFTSSRLDVFLCAMRQHKIIPKRLRPVYPSIKNNSGVFLIECVKNGGDGMNILSPLIVRDENNNYTPELLRLYEF